MCLFITNYSHDKGPLLIRSNDKTDLTKSTLPNHLLDMKSRFFELTAKNGEKAHVRTGREEMSGSPR